MKIELNIISHHIQNEIQNGGSTAQNYWHARAKRSDDQSYVANYNAPHRLHQGHQGTHILFGKVHYSINIENFY